MSERVVRVLPDVAAIDKEFDYEVPDALADRVSVGTMVRIQLGGRRAGGWVVADGVEPTSPGRALRPLAGVTGLGPSPDLIDLARWAAWRWAGHPATFLTTASPPRAVLLAARAAASALPSADAPPAMRRVVRIPPAADSFPYIASAAAAGPTLVLCPSTDDASLAAHRLRRSGLPVAFLPGDWATAAAGGVSVIGARAAAWGPAPDCTSVIVVDAHDQSYQEERAPTWNAWVVAAERAARAGIPCILLSPCPTLEMLEWASDVIVPGRSDERAGWPPLELVDRRGDDPRAGLYSQRLVDVVRSGVRTLCVLNTKGRARLLACAMCGELARCESCRSPVAEIDGALQCRRCGLSRPRLCAACGSQRLKALRVGVSRVREELEALAGVPVGEVTSSSTEVPDTAVVVGTEAVLHRVANADVVAFVDFDQELLAPRFRASELALTLLVRAARLVGGRQGAGRLMIQTRLPDHPVLDAAVHADPSRLAAAEAPLRIDLRLPPETAIALVDGEAAAAFVQGLPGTVEALGPDEGRWLVRAADHRELCDALASAARPAGRLRIEVDPMRV